MDSKGKTRIQPLHELSGLDGVDTFALPGVPFLLKLDDSRQFDFAIFDQSDTVVDHSSKGLYLPE